MFLNIFKLHRSRRARCAARLASWSATNIFEPYIYNNTNKGHSKQHEDRRTLVRSRWFERVMVCQDELTCSVRVFRLPEGSQHLTTANDNRCALT